MSLRPSGPRPPHLWVIGVIALLWNAGGAYNYIIAQTADAATLNEMGEGMAEYYASMPIWAETAWAVAIWFSVAGSVLLLMRSKWAYPVFGLAFLGLLVSSVWSFTGGGALEVMGSFAFVFTLAIFLISGFLVGYSYRQVRLGVLR